MRKKPIFILDKEEQDLSDSFDNGEWRSTKNLAKEKLKARAASLEACYYDASQKADDAFEIITSDGLEKNEKW
jgi:hypothetical protein